MDSKFFSQVIDVLKTLVDSRTVPTDLRQALLLQQAGRHAIEQGPKAERSSSNELLAKFQVGLPIDWVLLSGDPRVILPTALEAWLTASKPPAVPGLYGPINQVKGRKSVKKQPRRFCLRTLSMVAEKDLADYDLCFDFAAPGLRPLQFMSSNLEMLSGLMLCGFSARWTGSKASSNDPAAWFEWPHPQDCVALDERATSQEDLKQFWRHEDPTAFKEELPKANRPTDPMRSRLIRTHHVIFAEARAGRLRQSQVRRQVQKSLTDGTSTGSFDSTVELKLLPRQAIHFHGSQTRGKLFSCYYLTSCTLIEGQSATGKSTLAMQLALPGSGAAGFESSPLLFVSCDKPADVVEHQLLAVQARLAAEQELNPNLESSAPKSSGTPSEEEQSRTNRIMSCVRVVDIFGDDPQAPNAWKPWLKRWMTSCIAAQADHPSRAKMGTPTLVIDSIEAFVVWARRSTRRGSRSPAADQVLQKLRKFCWDANWRLIIVSDHELDLSRRRQDQSLQATSDCHLNLRRNGDSKVNLTVLKMPTYSFVQTIELEWYRTPRSDRRRWFVDCEEG